MGTTSSVSKLRSAACRYGSAIPGWRIPALYRDHYSVYTTTSGTIRTFSVFICIPRAFTLSSGVVAFFSSLGRGLAGGGVVHVCGNDKTSD